VRGREQQQQFDDVDHERRRYEQRRLDEWRVLRRRWVGEHGAGDRLVLGSEHGDVHDGDDHHAVVDDQERHLDDHQHRRARRL
jgi:hypothetical protein